MNRSALPLVRHSGCGSTGPFNRGELDVAVLGGGSWDWRSVEDSAAALVTCSGECVQ